MNETKSTAHRAGILYLLIVLLAPFSLIYVPSRFVVSGDAAATARNIMEGELLYRIGVLADVAGQIVFIALAATLYVLFREVNRKLALLMLTFVAVAVSFALVNALNRLGPLIVLSGRQYLTVFSTRELEAMAYAFLALRGGGSAIVTALWGLWLLPFGMLVIRSGYFPRILGVFLIMACCGLVAESFVAIVLPAQRGLVGPIAWSLDALGELPIAFWLLIKGARVP